jgi:hypothetical protein
MKHKGGCFCGKIRYEFEAEDIPVADCHCSMCRRTSGAPYVSWLVVKTPDFRFTQGKAKELKSSENGRRYFCDDCGTPVTCVSSNHPEIVDVTLGSLDEPESFTPVHTVFEDTKLPFVITQALENSSSE